MPPRGDSPAAWPARALLLALVLAAWGRVPAGAFQYDDHPNVVEDPATADARVLGERLRTGVRPLLRLTYFADHAAWGMRARGFLATNLALHAVAVLALHALARRRLGSELGALTAAAALALQPAGAEVVAYVSGRSTGLMTALLLLALLAHERGREAASRAWRALALALFAAACLAREVALVFPLLLALWEWTRPGGGARAAGRAAAPAVALALGVAALLALSPRYRTLAAYSLALRPAADSLAVGLAALPGLLSLWLRPWALSVEHGFDAAAVTRAQVLAGAALVAALGAACLLLRRRAPTLALAAGWVPLALAPTHTLLARLDVVTERPLYLAWVGPALLLGAGVAAATARASAPRTLAVLAPLVALLALGGVWCARRTQVWSDPQRLWEDAVAKAPHAARAWNNLGVALLGRDPPRAAAALRRALALEPTHRHARRTLATLDVLCGAPCRAPRE